MAVQTATKGGRGADGTPCGTPDEQPAAVLIARVARLVRSRLDAALGPSELRPRQLVALSYLRDHGPARQQALAQSLCMDASGLVCLLNDLEDRDLIVPSLVDRLGLVGTRPQLFERIAGMEKAGIDEVVIQPVVDPETEMRELAELMS